MNEVLPVALERTAQDTLQAWLESEDRTPEKVPDEAVAEEDEATRNFEAQVQAMDDIEKDVGRTFPEHSDFTQKKELSEGAGVTKLRNVLGAYAMRNPKVGYCQVTDNFPILLTVK